MQQLLMIEDDTRLAGMVADYLGQNGFAVAHAPDARSGLDRLQLSNIDLVILDLMLPDMDGLQVCQCIRAWRHESGAGAHADRQRRPDGPHHWPGNGGRRLFAQTL